MNIGRRNNYGGYCSNFRGSLFYTPYLDELDNPQMVNEMKNMNISATRLAYGTPELPTTVYSRPTAYTVSGYNNQRPLHAMDLLQKRSAHRDHLVAGEGHYDGCTRSPYDPITEAMDSFSKRVLKRRSCLTLADTDPPGSRNSGYTYEGENTLDGRVIDPTHFGTRPDLGRMGHSVTHLDYQPWQVLNGREHHLTLSPTATKVNSYNRFKELDPCFITKVPRSECDKRESVYVQDYPPKSNYCDATGKRVCGKGMSVYSGPPDLNLFQGDSYYLTETKERFVSPVNEGRARHGHLRGAVLQPISTSGFQTGNNEAKRGAEFLCATAEDKVALEPQRYNPWPRVLTGYKGMLDHNFRPHPTAPGADYELQKVQNGTTYESYPALV